MPKRNEEHWSFAALRKRLSEQTQVIIPTPEDYKEGEPKVLRTTITPNWEGGTILLFDPALERQLDADFYRVLYPVVFEVFESEPFQIPAIDEIKLTGNRSFGEAARSAMFSMHDPARRSGTEERPWWSVGFDLDVREPGYHIGTRLSVFLPHYVESEWSLDFIIEARNWDDKPALSAEHDGMRLSFSRGKYESFRWGGRQEEGWTNQLTDPFRKHLQIAKAVDRFAQEPSNRFLRSHMFQTFMEAYKGY